MKYIFLFISAITFLELYAGPTEIFENFLKTNPAIDNLAKELDKLSNVSVRTGALKKVQAKYGNAVKGELEIIIKAPSGQAVWSLNNYRSSSKPVVITKTEIVKDTVESDRLKTENARLAAQLIEANKKHEDLQKELAGYPRGSKSDIPPAPPLSGGRQTPPAPPASGKGPMNLGGSARPALQEGLLNQLGGKKEVAIEQEVIDKQNLNENEKKESDKKVLETLLLLAGTEGSYDTINSFEQKIDAEFKALYKNKSFNNRLKLAIVGKELKALFDKNKPTKDADFEKYYTPKTTSFNVGSAGAVHIVIFDKVASQYTDFSESLKQIMGDLFFDRSFIVNFDKKKLETLAINYLAGQRKKIEIPKDDRKPSNRTEPHKKSDRTLMATIIHAVESLSIKDGALSIPKEEQGKKREELRKALDLLRINPAFIGYKEMLPSSKEAQSEKPKLGAQPKIPLLILIDQDKISEIALKKELLNHLYLDQGGLEDFLNHLDKIPESKTLTKMALLLSKPKIEGIKKDEKADSISEGAKKLLEFLIEARKEYKENPNKRFETVLLEKIEKNKRVLEPLNKIKYGNLSKMLGSFDRTADKVLSALKDLLGTKESRFLEDAQSIKDANKILNIAVNLKDTSNIKAFNLIEIDRLMAEIPIVLKQFNIFLSALDKADKKDWLDIYLKFATNFSSEKQNINKTTKDFDSVNLKTITQLCKGAFDAQKETITKDAIALMNVKEIYEIKNIVDSHIKDLYKNKGAKISKEITDLMDKEISATQFVQKDNPDLDIFRKKLQDRLSAILPLVYEKTLTDAYQKALKGHEKI